MTGQEVARLISALEREYPSRRNDELSDQDRAERMLIWSSALAGVPYMDAMKALPGLFSRCQFFPKLPEVLDAMKASGPDSIDVLAAQDAEYRAAFPDWTHDGVTRVQRNERMRAKLEGGTQLRVAE